MKKIFELVNYKNQVLNVILKIAFVCFVTIVLFVLTCFIISFALADSVSDRILTARQEGEHYDCIIVLGAGLKTDGRPSDMLEDRIKTGVEIFNTGCADYILMSGDRSGDDYDEPGAMKTYAEMLNVDGKCILLDSQGFSTYESITRAKDIYGFDKVIIITQEYHLYRALYIADRCDIDAVGYSADLRTYRGQAFRDFREILARVKDFFWCK